MNVVTAEKVNQIKKECLEMCVHAGVGHVTSALSCAEIVSVLYYEIMRTNPKEPTWEGRDRFLMSKNHGSVITYPILRDMGFFQDNDMPHFMQNGSCLGVHTKKDVPGADFYGGSLGLGLGMACGMAYGAKLSRQNWLTFCLVGDGECYEGSIWEAAMFAGAKKLNNLVVIVDRNQMCITDFTEKMLPLESLNEKWAAFGWEVRNIDGHNMEEIRSALKDIRKRIGKPLCVIANTIKGHGIDFMENQPLWHGRAPSGEQAIRAVQQMKG